MPLSLSHAKPAVLDESKAGVEQGNQENGFVPIVSIVVPFFG